MARWFECPYLGSPVELTDERESHIAMRHADMTAELAELIGRTLAEPDAVHETGVYDDRLLFSRWYSELRGGKHVLVVVVTETGASSRNWIVTAHMLRKPVPGEALWRRS